MSGAGVDISGAAEAIAGLGEMARRLEHPLPMWETIGLSLVTSTQHRFETGVGPSGSPWPPSIEARAQGRRTLIKSARLMQSITFNASDTGVEVGTNVIYAAVHQFGATIRPVSKAKLSFMLLGKRVFADQVTIPARPFLGLDEEDINEMTAIAGDFAAGPEAGDVH